MGGILGKPCREPRCSAIVTGKDNYCEKHKPAKWVQGGQAPERLTFYSGERWQKLRKIKLAQNPICEICNGRFATQVHHLSKARDDLAGRYDMNNLQSVCVWCHAKETQKETLATRLEKSSGGNRAP